MFNFERFFQNKRALWLPTIRAAAALEHKNADRALELLKRASALELGAGGNLWPVYLRGETYLMLRDGKAAAEEFQKFVDHRGMVGSFPLSVQIEAEAIRTNQHAVFVRG